MMMKCILMVLLIPQFLHLCLMSNPPEWPDLTRHRLLTECVLFLQSDQPQIVEEAITGTLLLKQLYPDAARIAFLPLLSRLQETGSTVQIRHHARIARLYLQGQPIGGQYPVIDFNRLFKSGVAPLSFRDSLLLFLQIRHTRMQANLDSDQRRTPLTVAEKTGNDGIQFH